MMSYCPECGAKIVPGDRFCGGCGIDIKSLEVSELSQHSPTPPPSPAYQQPHLPTAPYPAPGTRAEGGQPAAGGNLDNLGGPSTGNKNALLIMISVLMAVFLAGGGLYWWFARGQDPGSETSPPTASQNEASAPDGQPRLDVPAVAPAQLELTRASTYLSEPGLKYTFFVNYPDGMSGVVDRISGQVVPNESVRVSEVEVGIDRGEEYGYGFHYVERADGTYYIMDSSPYEIFPVLKNNMAVGQTWNYQDEFGSITWTVLDMGVDLNLGFTSIENCLLLEEDNQAADFQSISYYAPGRGIVLVIEPGGSTEFYKLTALGKIDLALAAETIKKWCPNYYDIKDDRTQSY